jgi:GTPase
MMNNEAGPSEATRAGYVALLGYPNAGKSSLLNRLLDQKLSIVTALPQTTRERVVGIDTRDGVQMVFVDTPGLVEPRYLLHRSMLHEALQAVPDADVALMIIDPLQPLPSLEVEPFPALQKRSGRVIIVINKIDSSSTKQIAAAEEWARQGGFARVSRVSALSGEGIDSLRREIAESLPESPYFFPPDEISSQPVRFFVAELVRETIFEIFKDEIPYSVAVRVEEYREADTPVYIRATIFVERASQKGILIGSGGAAIRRLGQESRVKIEEFVGAPVYLDLWIKVLSRWRKDAGSLRHLGYLVPPNSHG